VSYHSELQFRAFGHLSGIPRRIPNDFHLSALDALNGTDLRFNFNRKRSSDRTSRSRESHLDPHIGGIADLYSVNQTELIDVDWNFRIVAGLESIDHLQFQELLFHRIHFTSPR